MNFKRAIWQSWLVGLIVLTVAAPVRADWKDIARKFHPYLTLTEEYNDNIYLDRENKTGDFITTISPGIRFSHSENPFGIDLDYILGLNFYADQNNRNYISHNGNLNTWFRLGEGWTFRLRDYLVRSEDPLERDFAYTGTGQRYTLSVNRDRRPYLRNVVEPSVEYRYGRDSRVNLLYRNNMYRTDSSVANDSTENAVNPLLTHWFDVRNGMILDYTYSTGTFEQDPNLVAHSTRGRYMYRLNPHTVAFGEFVYLIREYDSPGVDYSVYNPSLGVDHAFSSTLSGTLQVGYFWQDAAGIPTFSGPTFNINLTQRAHLTTYRFALEGGYREDFFTSENLGFTKYYRAVGTVSRELYARTRGELSGSVERAEYSESAPGRIDWLYGLQRLRLLPASPLAERQPWNKPCPGSVEPEPDDYIENRGILRFTATY